MAITQRPNTGDVFIYDMTYPGRADPLTAYFMIIGTIDGSKTIKWDVYINPDPGLNGGLGETALEIWCTEAFNSSELAALESVINTPTFSLKSDKTELILGSDFATLTAISAQGVATALIDVNGTQHSISVGTPLAPVTFTIASNLQPGLIVVSPVAGQPQFMPIKIKVNELTDYTLA